MSGIERIATERARQIVIGYAVIHDDQHVEGELAIAASCYADLAACLAVGAKTEEMREMYFGRTRIAWPFEEESFAPSDDPIRNLEKAGALIAAEIDRIERLRGITA